MRGLWPPLLFIFGLLPSCLEYGYNGEKGADPLPDIEVSPSSLDFGALDYGEEQTEVVRISNLGGADLSLTGIELGGESEAFTLSTTDTLTTLTPGESTDLLVTYTPWTTLDAGVARIASDDPDEPTVDVDLSGSLDVPLLVFDPDPMDLGGLPVGANTSSDLTISNEGVADLELYGLMISGDAFSGELPSLPLTLAPGESTSLPITFDALSEGTFEGRVWASSNAGTGTDSVVLTGIGSSGPVAICDVDPDVVTSHDDQPTWIGDESYDPAGAEIVSYDWELLEAPTGSAAEMPGRDTDADRRDFAWDLAGEYMARLVVTNEFGQVSAPCDAVLVAAPSDDLWIEMYWEHAQDDMDLHLLAPGGSKWGSLDCHWQNCVDGGLDWGEPGDDADDPSLDLDDIAGTGPENIRIEDPEYGEYTVLVHDYPASRYRSDNAVTVNIFVGGALVFTETREISGEDTWESYAYVSFPDGTVTGL